MNYLRFFAPALFAFAMLVCTEAIAIEIGAPAPNLDLKLLDGKVLKAQDLRGKVVLQMFWATWCTVCQKELPELQKFYSQYRGKGFVLLALSFDDTEKEVKEFWKSKGYTFPVAMRDERHLKAYGEVTVRPAFFLLDKQGIIRYKQYGPISHAKLEELVKPLL